MAVRYHLPRRVGVGASGNVGVEPDPKATIQRFDADAGSISGPLYPVNFPNSAALG